MCSNDTFQGAFSNAWRRSFHMPETTSILELNQRLSFGECRHSERSPNQYHIRIIPVVEYLENSSTTCLSLLCVTHMSITIYISYYHHLNAIWKETFMANGSNASPSTFQLSIENMNRMPMDNHLALCEWVYGQCDVHAYARIVPFYVVAVLIHTHSHTHTCTHTNRLFHIIILLFISIRLADILNGWRWGGMQANLSVSVSVSKSQLLSTSLDK